MGSMMEGRGVVAGAINGFAGCSCGLRSAC